MSAPIDVDSIFYDADGALRHDPERRRDREAELRAFAQADARPPTASWYIVDASWMGAWLAFADTTVYADRASPAPGPVPNARLLVSAADDHHHPVGDHPPGVVVSWRPREGLAPQTYDKKKGVSGGHFRRVNAAVWAEIVKRYPGSGPSIRVDEPPYDDPANWIVGDAADVYAPPDDEVLSRERRRRRRRPAGAPATALPPRGGDATTATTTERRRRAPGSAEPPASAAAAAAADGETDPATSTPGAGGRNPQRRPALSPVANPLV